MKDVLKILMLEDSFLDAEMIQRTLKKDEFFATEFNLAKNKEEFLLALNEFNPDVILADNSLPQFDAAEALKIARQQLSYIPFIMVTGTVSEEFAASIIKRGADDYILKDRLARIPAAITNALKQQRIEREKQEAFNRLKKSEEKFRNLLESAPDAMIITNENGIIQLINEQTEKLFGFHDEEIIAKEIKLFLPDWNENPGVTERIDSFKTMHVKLIKDGIELSGQTKDGQSFPVEINISPLETNEGILIIVAIRDISERKKSEEALRLMEQKILNQKIQEQKKITRAIIKAQEKERNYIGQELHDNVNQILVSTKLYLGLAAKNRDEVKALIKYPVELIENSINEIRLLTGKYVTPLKNVILKELLIELMEKLELNTGIKTTFIYDIPDESIEDDLKLNIYRIIQEQVNNVTKHAEAKEVLIELTGDNNVIRILFKDDGKGFDLDKRRKGVGISNIINRIESFNGEIIINSSVGNGCMMQVALPMR